jgi:CheY-like chemotaxis protein
VVHGIVRAHGGEIAVESEPGRGTRIDVRLPASQRGAEREAPCASTPEAVQGRGLVLVVDDEGAVRDVARLALEAAGYTVLCAANAAEASERAREAGASLGVVLLDLSLGRSSSEPVIAALREISPDVAILVTSGYAEDDALERLAPYRIAGFLQKPFTPAQLAARMADALARSGRS